MKIKNAILSKKWQIAFTTLGLIVCAVLIRMFYENSELTTPFFIIVGILNIAGYIYSEYTKRIFDQMIKYRYLVALIVFIFCVVFQLHGSSISQYNVTFDDLDVYQDVLVGNGRSIRSDEFVVQVPYYFSQSANDYEQVSYQMSLSGQDMIIGYNAPVLNPLLIAKPLTWGYLLFGNTYGLSWYWCGKLILCLLMVYELCSLITKNQKVISVLGSFALVFSPMMQWWFSPHMYDVFMWATTLCVAGYYFFMGKGKWKWLYTILAPLAAVAFVLALFPSLQVAAGMLVAALLVVFLIRDREAFQFGKSDVFRLIVAIVIASGLLIYFAVTSYDAIISLFTTAYPGERISVGGDGTLASLFSNLTCFKTPFVDTNISNNSEISTFNHLGGLMLLSFPYIWKKRTKESRPDLLIGSVFFTVLLIQVEFMLIGMPEMLAKITLFSYINRMDIAYGFTATLATVWFVYYIVKYREQHNKYIFMGMSIVFAFLQMCSLTQENLDFMPGYIFIVLIGLFASVTCLVLKKKYYVAGSVVVLLTVISGFTVNPIVTGTSAIYEHEISNEIAECIEENDGYWLAIDSLVTQNFLVANGAKVINAVNFYPDDKKWEVIDPDGIYEFNYNRYAHIAVVLEEVDTTIDLVPPDCIVVHLDTAVLKELNITYILTMIDYTELFEKYDLNYVKTYTDSSGYMIYTLQE